MKTRMLFPAMASALLYVAAVAPSQAQQPTCKVRLSVVYPHVGGMQDYRLWKQAEDASEAARQSLLRNEEQQCFGHLGQVVQSLVQNRARNMG